MSILLQDTFKLPTPPVLVTNEFAYWNPSDPKAIKSTVWEMTSGSLYNKDGWGWTGVIDDKAPNYNSTTGTNSAVFRATTKKSDFTNFAVSFLLNTKASVSTPSTPAVDWDGTHIFLRYVSQYSLYYASVCRRDGKVVIKKKVPGGPSNSGTYYDISSYISKPFPRNDYVRVKATIQTLSDNTVNIQLYSKGVLLVEAIDNGIGGAPILAAGKTGIRGDNTEFTFDEFTVESI